jgi:hypothetical protein
MVKIMKTVLCYGFMFVDKVAMFVEFLPWIYDETSQGFLAVLLVAY